MLFISTASIASQEVIVACEKISSITSNIELSGGCDYSEKLLEHLVCFQKERNINFLLHNYFPPPANHFLLNLAASNTQTRNFIRQSIYYIQKLSLPYYSIHAGFKANFEKKGELLFASGHPTFFTWADWEDNINWYLQEFNNIPLCLENMFPNNNLNCGFMMNIGEITEALEHFPALSLLLDLGHLQIAAHYAQFDYFNAVDLLMNRYGSRIREIHLSENNGISDEHLLVTHNSFQYKILKEFIGMINRYKINLTIETRQADLSSLKKSYELIAALLV